jgi:hypothetical protein
MLAPIRRRMDAELKPEFVNFSTDLLCEALSRFDSAVFDDQAKFISTQAGEYIALLDMSSDHADDLLEQPVSRRVPTRIVDQLELVQIDIHQSIFRRAFMGGNQRQLQSTLEFVPVDETCQGIVCRTVCHFATQATLLRDVAKYQHTS